MKRKVNKPKPTKSVRKPVRRKRPVINELASTAVNEPKGPGKIPDPQPDESRVRIIINEPNDAKEIGSSGLKAYNGYISEAYDPKLYWPGVSPLFTRIRTSTPEIVMVVRAFTTWARNIKPLVELPTEPTDDDKKYQEFIYSDFDNMEGGFGDFIETAVSRVPFDGWFWWDVVPAIRAIDWMPPNYSDGYPDDWRSEEDDGLIGIRRLAARDTSSFEKWEMTPGKHLVGMWQHDYPHPSIFLPLSHGLHMTFGDSTNPEGSSPLQAVWRLERIKYGLEVIQGIGYEHAAGHLSVQRTQPGTISDADRSNIKSAALGILSAQEGNYAIWPYTYQGKVEDIPFQAGGNLLEAIKHYSILILSVYMMQTIALNTLTNTGALASQVDSTQLAIFTFNNMIDGLAQQYDSQVGKRLFHWNKAQFPGITKRPRIKFSHVENNVALGTLGSFLQSINGILPLGEEDMLAIRQRSGFLPQTQPDPEEQMIQNSMLSGMDQQPEEASTEYPDDAIFSNEVQRNKQ